MQPKTPDPTKPNRARSEIDPGDSASQISRRSRSRSQGGRRRSRQSNTFNSHLSQLTSVLSQALGRPQLRRRSRSRARPNSKKPVWVPKPLAIEKASSNTTIPVSNSLPDVSASLTGTLDCRLILHPSNPRLFPNLVGIWPHFQQYSFSDFNLQATPVASSLSSGAVAVATLANCRPDTSDPIALGPAFSFLLNLSTVAVTTLWRELKYRVAPTVIRRLSNYLIDSIDDSTSSPGTLAIASNVSTSSSNDAPPQMPILGIETKVHLKDFRPSSSSDSPVGLIGRAVQGVVGGMDRAFGNYQPLQTVTPTITVDSSSIYSLFKVTGASGTLNFVATCSLPNTFLVPSLLVSGTVYQALHYWVSKTFIEAVYQVPVTGTTFVSSQGLVAKESPSIGDWLWTFTFTPSTPSIANVFRHLNYHIRQRTLTRHATVPQNLPELVRPQRDPVFHDPFQLINSFQHLTIYQEPQECSVSPPPRLIEPKRPSPQKRPSPPKSTLVPFSPTGQGWCWLLAICRMVPSLEIFKLGDQLILLTDDAQYRAPCRAYLASEFYLPLLDKMGLTQQLALTHRLIASENGFGHLVARPKPLTTVDVQAFILSLHGLVLGGFLHRSGVLSPQLVAAIAALDSESEEPA